MTTPPDLAEFPSEEAVQRGLVQRYAELGQRIAEMKEQQDAIKTRLRVLGRGRHDIGDNKVTISANTRFDPELADTVLRAIHPDLVAKCSVSKIDATLTKKWVSGEVYGRCQRQAGEDKVVIA